MQRIPREEQVSRKNEAKQLLEHPLLVEFFTEAEKQIFNRWKASGQGGVEEREMIYLQQLGLEALSDFFHKIIVDGRIAEKEINEKLQRGE